MTHIYWCATIFENRSMWNISIDMAMGGGDTFTWNIQNIITSDKTSYLYMFYRVSQKTQHFSIPWSEVHFSPHILILFHIQKKTLLYTNLSSTGLLQEHSSFDKIGRSIYFWISNPGHQKLQFSIQMRNITHVIAIISKT